MHAAMDSDSNIKQFLLKLSSRNKFKHAKILNNKYPLQKKSKTFFCQDLNWTKIFLLKSEKLGEKTTILTKT